MGLVVLAVIDSLKQAGPHPLLYTDVCSPYLYAGFEAVDV